MISRRNFIKTNALTAGLLSLPALISACTTPQKQTKRPYYSPDELSTLQRNLSDLTAICLNDAAGYGFELKTGNTTSKVVIDPYELRGVENPLQRKILSESPAVISTHIHFDHTGDIEATLEKDPNQIWYCTKEAKRAFTNIAKDKSLLSRVAVPEIGKTLQIAPGIQFEALHAYHGKFGASLVLETLRHAFLNPKGQAQTFEEWPEILSHFKTLYGYELIAPRLTFDTREGKKRILFLGSTNAISLPHLRDKPLDALFITHQGKKDPDMANEIAWIAQKLKPKTLVMIHYRPILKVAGNFARAINPDNVKRKIEEKGLDIKVLAPNVGEKVYL